MATQPLFQRHRRSVCVLATAAAIVVALALAPPAHAKSTRSRSLIVYAGDTYQSTGQIFVARPGGKRHQVTHGPHYRDLPRWSPHGRRILYRDYGKNAKRLYPVLMMMGAGGRHQHKVLGGPRLDIIDYAWGPSGRRIVVSMAINGGAGNDLFTYSLGSRKLRRLHVDIPGRIPSTLDWSRDGKHIVFAGLDPNGDDGAPGSGANLYVINPDGSGLHQLTTTPSKGIFDGWPRWSPDGRSVLFIRDDEDTGRCSSALFVMRADGTGRQRVPIGCSVNNAGWSPGGGRLLAEIYSGRRGLNAVSFAIDGSHRRVIARHAMCPSWRPS